MGIGVFSRRLMKKGKGCRKDIRPSPEVDRLDLVLTMAQGEKNEGEEKGNGIDLGVGYLANK